MREAATANFGECVQQDAGTRPIVGPERRVGIAGHDPLAAADGLRADTKRDRIDMRGQEPPRFSDRPRQFHDQISRLAAKRAPLVGRVFRHGRRGNTDLLQPRPNGRNDGPFLAAATGNGHEFGHQFDGSAFVDLEKVARRREGFHHQQSRG